MAYVKLQNVQRVAIYIRVSTAFQVDKDSLPMQREDLINYCKYVLNIKDYVVYEDAGYSAKNTDRPAFQKMMTQVREHNFSHVLVWKIDRISRNLLDFSAMYKELKDLGVIFVSKNEQFDTSSAMGEAMLKIILVFAELERNMTSERVSAIMISRANEGKWNGGRIPYGYDYNKITREITPNENESRIVNIIFEKYSELRSLAKVASYLNGKLVKTRLEKDWHPTTLYVIITNVFYIGTYRYNYLVNSTRSNKRPESEWVIYENHHPAIVDKAIFDKCNQILIDNAKTQKLNGLRRVQNHPHVFGRILRCDKCGSTFTSSTSSKVGYGRRWQYGRYLCPMTKTHDCKAKQTSDPVVGEFVFNYVLNLMNAQKKKDKIATPKMLESALLKGTTFKEYSHIDEYGINELFQIIKSHTDQEVIFGTNLNLKPRKKEISEMEFLRKEKDRLERALDRLRSLYLYSDEAMSEKEFTTEKIRIAEQLDEVYAKLEMSEPDLSDIPISDDDFIDLAGRFIMIQRLTNRVYINYRSLAESVDREVLRNFVASIIDSINILDGKIESITFKNGLCQHFILK